MRRRAMTSEQASKKKTSGHQNEYDFAEVIGGQVRSDAPQGKPDVIDLQSRLHSVKGGTWWQIFLYSRQRLQSNTALQSIGDLANLMTQCVDAFPEEMDDYTADKESAKTRLQAPMRLLKQEIEKPGIFPALIDKSFFNGNVDYLSALPSDFSNSSPIDQKHFHIFHRDDVVEQLAEHLEIRNSKARHSKQWDDQKVIVRYGKNAGEIEIRTDSLVHYRRIKWRMNSDLTFEILKSHLESEQRPRHQITVYGRAIGTFSIE